MSSSIKEQTVGGYVSEYANSHHVSVVHALQTAMGKEVLKSFAERSIAEQNKGSGRINDVCIGFCHGDDNNRSC